MDRKWYNIELDRLTAQAHSFFDDKEKMLDFFQLSKAEFLKSYSYLTEEEYNATAHDVWERAYKLLRGAYGAL